MLVTYPMHVHSYAHVPDHIDPWRAFAAGSSAPASSPAWAESDDPKNAMPPPDAAGTLWRAHQWPEDRAVPPTILEAAAWLREEFGLGDDLDVVVAPLGAYFSSGGAGIFLIQVGGAHYVMVCRGDEPTPRYGHREEFLAAYGCDVMAVRE